MNIDWGLIVFSFVRAAVLVGLMAAAVIYVLSQIAIGDFGVR